MRFAALMTASAAFGGCGGSRPSPPLPSEAQPLTAAEATLLLDEFIPATPNRYDLTWTYSTRQATHRGRATAWFVPPDSLRFEYRAPFGRRGAAVFVGQRVVWANPEETVKDLIPATQLFWIALGIPVTPEASEPPTRTQRPDGWALRYVQGDTVLLFNLTRGTPLNLTAMLTHGRRVFGTAYVAYTDSTTLPTQGRMMFPQSSAVFSATVEEVDTLASVDRGMFQKP
jgi:hypothetical protein